MSCYEWSHGKIKLPSAAFAPFKKAIQEAATKDLQAKFDAAQKFWASLTPKQKTDATEFQRAIWNLRDGSEHLPWQATYVPHGGKPKRLLKGDLDWPTNRTLSFGDGEFTLTFDPKERTVTYSVSENNHAREWAEKTAIHKAFMQQIGKVRWTAGTGGVITGNDEYNRDDDHVGGGGNYVVAAYGYVGIKEAPTNVGSFTNAKGERIKCEVKMGRYGLVGKAVKDTGPAYGRRYAW